MLETYLKDILKISRSTRDVVQGREKDVCKLMKSLYGLKQAPRA